MTTMSFTLFQLSGTWSNDASGRLVGDYTNNSFGDLLNGTFVGKATSGKKLEMNVRALDGLFKFDGKPATGTPDFSGPWTASIAEPHVLSGRGPVLESSMKPHTGSIETYEIVGSNVFPGVFDIAGIGTGTNGPFTITGKAILTARGKVTMFKFNGFQSGDSTTDIATGKFNERKQTAVLNGQDTSGPLWRAKLSRPEM